MAWGRDMGTPRRLGMLYFFIHKEIKKEKHVVRIITEKPPCSLRVSVAVQKPTLWEVGGGQPRVQSAGA